MIQTELTLDEWWTYAKHESLYVRFSIVKTHIDSIPIEILEYLANDEHWYIRMGVATHPKTPVKNLKYLVLDDNPNVALGVLYDPNATEEVRITYNAAVKYKHLLIR
jgi:hypothetical protein